MDYADAADARSFFDAWREQLCDQTRAIRKLRAMIDRNCDGVVAIASDARHPARFVEGLNNKIRVLQRRATACATRNISNSKSSHPAAEL